MNSPEKFSGRNSEETYRWSREILVNPKQPILIGDVSGILRPGITPIDFDNEVEAMVASSFNTDARYISASSMDSIFTDIVTDVFTNVDPKTALVIFPGNGANTVRRENPKMWSKIQDQFPIVALTSNRIVQNNIPIGVTIDLSEQDKTLITDIKPKNIVVIDDVIAKGMTIKTIKKMIEQYANKETTFQAATWFLRGDADTTGYDRISAVYRYSAIEGYPALNSISTWLKDDEKSSIVLESYKKRYIQYPYGFTKSLTRLKEMIYETK